MSDDGSEISSSLKDLVKHSKCWFHCSCHFLDLVSGDYVENNEDIQEAQKAVCSQFGINLGPMYYMYMCVVLTAYF